MGSGLHRPRGARLYRIQGGSCGASFSLALSIARSIIVWSPTRRQNGWNFPGEVRTKWTMSVDEGGRCSRTDNSRGESTFTEGTILDSWRKKLHKLKAPMHLPPQGGRCIMPLTSPEWFGARDAHW